MTPRNYLIPFRRQRSKERNLKPIPNPLSWVKTHIPRNQAQFEAEAKVALKYIFGVALLAPVVIVPLYYLFIALMR
jgi:hypothetical protein